MIPKNTKKPKKSSKIDEKSERFIRVIGKRAQNVIDKLLTMGNFLTNSKNYSYNLEQIDLIFQPIEELVLKLREKFVENITKIDEKDIYKIDLSLKNVKKSDENVEK